MKCDYCDKPYVMTTKTDTGYAYECVNHYVNGDCEATAEYVEVDI